MEASVAAAPQEEPENAAALEPPTRRSARARREIIRNKPIHQGRAARSAARAVIVEGVSVRAAASAHGVLNHSLVHHYIANWRSTDVAAAIIKQHAESGVAAANGTQPAPAAAEACYEQAPVTQPSEEAAIAIPSPSSMAPIALPPIPDDLRAKRRHERQKWFAHVAAKLVANNSVSFRKATRQVNDFYANDKAAVPCTYSMVYTYARAGPAHDPKSKGKRPYLPLNFEDKLVSWVRAVRSLNFPVHKDSIIGVANSMLQRSSLLNKFKAGHLGRGWYYGFLTRYGHVLDTDTARPLEVDRAKWATAANVGPWYDMVAQELVKAGVAVANPDFDPAAPRDSPRSVQIHITEPERIVSFDETRVELDQAKYNSKAKKARIVIDRAVPREKQRDTIAQQGGLAGTGVGGSTASGRALPGFFILAAKSLSPLWCKPSPRCGFVDEEGVMRKPHFYANKKGGMEFDLGVRFFQLCVLPCFPHLSAARPLVVFCDGHGSHLTLELIEFCRAHHVCILLRVPHTSHLTQGEDLRNFQVFKSEFHAFKTAQLARNLDQNIYGLRSDDFMSMVAPAWDLAFAPEHCAAGWRDSGLYPFSRKVFFDLFDAEAAARNRCSEVGDSDNINYARLSFAAVYEGRLGNQEANDDEDADQEDALVRKSRLSSADLHRLGPVTADTAYNVLKRRAEERGAAEAERDDRRMAREQRAADEHVKAVRIVDQMTLTTTADINALTVTALKAYLRVKDATGWREHKKITNKAALVAAVRTLHPDLPDGEPQQRGRGRGGRGRGRGRGRGSTSAGGASAGTCVESDSNESELESEESGSDKSAEYEVERLTDACLDGEAFRFRVRWVGYAPSEDTWEPHEMLKVSAGEMLATFLKSREDAGEWPPTQTWEDIQE